MKKYITDSQEETKKVAKEFALELKGGEIICYFGEVGAGKTVFTQGLCKGLGFDGYVNSPSYIILNEYNTDKFNLYHYDLYRISSPDELTEIGFYDFAGKEKNITLVEWAELLEDELPEDRIEITINVLDAEKREIIIEQK